ncbi:hypothetical protein H0H12_10315 [Pseudomonas putida]|uniref:Sialate O-acetylesterase domain-containing protein n=1 Tax=Pseudomonas putida TaxID=303 RepID=A0A7D5W1R9_PSEPU|nr:hypothetical protein [Pseudomonas putida]QLJ16286.1 hypothetical protein H0H12_10315 [Pseudomonas putida]
MSGQQTIQELDRIVGTTNELLLSPEVKMMDVGGGVMRPTNAMVMTNLATLLGGAMPYASVALGLSGTADGTNFSVLSSAQDEYVNVYRNVSGSALFVDSYPNASATRKAGEAADAAYGLSQPRSLVDDFPWVITDQYYRAILGVKPSGAAHALLDTLPGLDLLGDYAWVTTDANGVVLLGIKWSGEVVVYGQSTGSVTAYADGPIGGQDIWVLVDGVPYQATSSGDNFSPKVADGKLSYIRRSGPVSSVTIDVPLPGSVATFVTTILHIVSGGQSLSMGATATTTTLQPPTANRLLTIQDGVRLTNQDDTLTSAMVAPFKPLIAKTNEVPAVQLSAQLNRIRGLPSNAGLLTSCHGRSGYAIAALSKGTLPYTNSITAVTNAKAEATRLGYGYRVPFVDWIQGENDANRGAGGYLTALLQLQSDYDTDIRAISGQPQTVPLLLDQISNWTMYGLTSSFVPLEQLQAALTYPTRFYCAGPKYWLQTNTDGIHLTAENSMRLGAMHARAAQAIIAGSTWKPTHAVSATRSGAVVTLRFHTPSGPLAIDTVNVTDPGNLGIRYVDDSGVASIQGVRLLGNNTVEVTLSAVPSGANPYIGIADIGTAGSAGGPVTGPRACLRDSSPDLDAYGQPIYNWACHQRINVQAA